MIKNPTEITPEVRASARRWTYRGVAVLCLFSILAVVGWHWRAGVQLREVEIRKTCDYGWELFGFVHDCLPLRASENELLTLVGEEPGVPLYRIDPRVIADRLNRNPWIRETSVSRTPNGKLIVEVTEREPVLLSMRAGRPDYFIDASGYRMPFIENAAYDVPLLFGLREEYRPLEPIRNPLVKNLAAVLPSLDAGVHALISEVELGKASLNVHAVVPGSARSVEVVIGPNEIGHQFEKLYAFWHQVLLESENPEVRQIDLRFKSQIITR